MGAIATQGLFTVNEIQLIFKNVIKCDRRDLNIK